MWLKADLQPSEIDFRSSPNTGHSEARVGLPVLTLSGHWSGCRCTVVMTPGERLRREFQPNLRDEMLNTGIFYMLKEAIVLIEGWSYRYDMVRPHSSLRS